MKFFIILLKRFAEFQKMDLYPIDFDKFAEY